MRRLLALIPCALLALFLRTATPPTPAQALVSERDRGPVDLVLTPDEKWLLTANQAAGTVSLVNVATGRVHAEVACGPRPSALALTPDGKRALVSATWSGEVAIFERDDDKLVRRGAIPVGHEPRGVAVSPDGKLAYVALTTAAAVAVLDLDANKVVDRIAVGRWPRYLALTADGKKLAVGVSGDGGVSVVDTGERKELYRESFVGLNLGQMQIAGEFAYFPWMIYRDNPITPTNIRLGWVLASRIGRVRLDGPTRREAFSLDVPGTAIADPHGLAISPDEQTLVCAASGTKELLVYRLPGLPFQDFGGTDHVDPKLAKDPARFARIPLGGRPMAVRYARDGQRVFVANEGLNAVQIVEPGQKKVVRTIDLGGPAEASLARRGAAIFHDGQRSLDQWYSCHSCHYDGHTNSVTMDTKNDGRFGNFKTVLSLRNVTHTGPWFWHGWAKDLPQAVRRSMTETMLGKEPAAGDVEAVIAYLDTLTPPPSPAPDAAARRGAEVFRSAKAGCARCHSGQYFTDGRIHDVGTNDRGDVYQGYNPPSLLGVNDRVLFLHDGRAASLEAALRGPHAPERVTGQGDLTEEELRDLLAYLRSL